MTPNEINQLMVFWHEVQDDCETVRGLLLQNLVQNNQQQNIQIGDVAVAMHRLGCLSAETNRVMPQYTRDFEEVRLELERIRNEILLVRQQTHPPAEAG